MLPESIIYTWEITDSLILNFYVEKKVRNIQKP